MPKVTIEIYDVMTDGREGVGVDMRTDRQGLPDDAQPSNAMLHALMIYRLWNAKALPYMTDVVCAQEVRIREMMRQREEQKQNAAGGKHLISTGDMEKMRQHAGAMQKQELADLRKDAGALDEKLRALAEQQKGAPPMDQDKDTPVVPLPGGRDVPVDLSEGGQEEAGGANDDQGSQGPAAA